MEPAGLSRERNLEGGFHNPGESKAVNHGTASIVTDVHAWNSSDFEPFVFSIICKGCELPNGISSPLVKQSAVAGADEFPRLLP